MRKIRQFFRLIRIGYVFSKQGVDDIILSTPFLEHISFLKYVNPWNWKKNHALTRGERLRTALEELGPIFIKFGQLLSTRSDLITPDIAKELAVLQDNVPPFPGEIAERKIAESLGQPLTSVFSEFQTQALASASIAQVHLAKLHDGSDVVVKVLRPGVKKMIQRDVSLLYTLAHFFKRWNRQVEQLRLVEAVAEFEQDLMAELDLLREAANASQLRRNFLNSEDLYIPQIYWDYCRHDVMVMERIHGIPISDVTTLKKQGFNLKKLAERGIHIFFTQVFRDCFFHADTHPGNIFVAKENTQNPQYIAVDFGIMGTLTDRDQRYLAENLMAFFNRDYRRVAQLHVESAWVPADIRLDLFESAIRTVCEPIFEKPLKDISAGQMLLRLFQTAQQFKMEIQPQLMLLQKTLITIEGVGRHIDPGLDLWQTAKPFMERWMRQQLGPRAFIREVRKQAPFWLEKLPELPDLIYRSLKRNVETPSFAHGSTHSPLPGPRPALAFKKNSKVSRLLILSSLSFLAAFGSLLLINTTYSLYVGMSFCGVGLVTLVGAWLKKN